MLIGERLQVFAYLHRKWLAAKTCERIDYYNEEMAEEVRAMTAQEAKVAYQIMREGCRANRSRVRD